MARPACAGEGYRLRPGIVPQNPQTLAFGDSGGLHYTTSLGTIPGNMTLFSRVSQFKFHDPAFHLIVSPHPFSRVLLGASRSSAFATAARVFAVIPDVERLANWQLLVGENATQHASHYCSNTTDASIEWFPLVNTVSRGWGIPGTISLSSVVNENVTLYLDTGGLDDLTITPYMLDEIVAHIESLGPRRIPWMFSFWSLVNPRYTRLPVFEQCNRDILSRLNSSSYDLIQQALFHFQSMNIWSSFTATDVDSI